MSEVQRVTLNEQELFDRLVVLLSDQMIQSEDIKQIKADTKFHKDKNPTGIPADQIALIAAAAKIEAQNVFEEFNEKNVAVTETFKRLSRYDE